MTILIKAATLFDPSSKHHGTTKDILIKDGVITTIRSKIASEKGVEELCLKDLCISKGWFDSSVHFGEPGYEERETIENGLKTAGLSGFTAVAVQPEGIPKTETAAAVGFLKAKSQGSPVSLYPIGTLTAGSKGIDLAELYDMQTAGAISFGDYKSAISNPNLLKIALLYSQGFGGIVQSYPQENQIAGKGIVNEGAASTALGLKGNPELAEALQIARDLYILEYTGGKLHIPTISSEKSVALIRQAKQKGLAVSCSVAIHNLVFTDAKLEGFDSNFKVKPPLRTNKSVDALIEGLQDGTIDMITSDHYPMDVEHKKMEFDNASYGTLGLESAFGVLQHRLDTDIIVKGLTAGRAVFGLPDNTIEEGNCADFTFFNTKEKSVFTAAHILSTSKNSAFLQQRMTGKVYGVFSNNQLLLNS